MSSASTMPGRRCTEMEMLELNNLHKTFNPGTVNEKVALSLIHI